MKFSILVTAAIANEKPWMTKEWQVQDAYHVNQEITLHDMKARSNRQWHDMWHDIMIYGLGSLMKFKKESG